MFLAVLVFHPARTPPAETSFAGLLPAYTFIVVTVFWKLILFRKFFEIFLISVTASGQCGDQLTNHPTRQYTFIIDTYGEGVNYAG